MENIKFYQIADLLDLEYDGDVEDTRLHGNEVLNWGAETEEDYEKATKEIDAISYNGNGWQVYAWYDVSGYDYWMVQQEEPNYINITVSFDSDEINKDEIANIQKAIDLAYEDAYSISERYDYTPNSEYRRGGKVDGRSTRAKNTWNRGAAWTIDRKKYNKSEDWEKPLNRRGRVKSKSSRESKSKDYTYVPNYMIRGAEVSNKGKTTDIDGANILDGIYVKAGTKFAGGGGVGDLSGNYYSTNDFVSANNLQKQAEEILGKGWTAENDVEQIEYIVNSLGGKYIVIIPEDRDDWNEMRNKYDLAHPTGDSNYDIFVIDADVYNDDDDEFAKGGRVKDYKYVPNYMIESVEVEKNGKTTEIDGDRVLDGLYVKGKTKFAKGGGINSGRDNLFKSQEPHEQRYKRKREWKEYKKDGWLGDWFKYGGGVGNIKVVNELNDKIEPVSVEKISKEFTGITGIHYIDNKSGGNLIVAVYTKNLGTLGVEDLVKIQNKLNAKSISISILPLLSELDGDGLIYILTY